MLVELSYVLFTFLLVAYGIWCYSKKRERILLHLTLSFAFLASSTTLQMLKVLLFGKFGIFVLRLIELSGLALFACFTILAAITLREAFGDANRSKKQE